jgi:hypothetical protein
LIVESFGVFLSFFCFGSTAWGMAQAQGEFDRSGMGFPSDFFDALNQGDKDAAMTSLKMAAHTPEGVLSPKVAEYNRQGEWDTRMELALVCFGSNQCGGRVGQDGYRICGKARDECATKAHAAAPAATPGWRISAGGKAAGCFANPGKRRSDLGPRGWRSSRWGGSVPSDQRPMAIHFRRVGGFPGH